MSCSSCAAVAGDVVDVAELDESLFFNDSEDALEQLSSSSITTLTDDEIDEAEQVSGRQTAAMVVGLASPVVILALTAYTAKRSQSTSLATAIGLASWLGLASLHKYLKADPEAPPA